MSFSKMKKFYKYEYFGVEKLYEYAYFKIKKHYRYEYPANLTFNKVHNIDKDLSIFCNNDN